MFGLMWTETHEALIAKAEAQRDTETLRANGLAAEAEAAKSAIERYRNMFAASEKRRNEIGAELDHWRQYGQLRDPATGRLIPKDNAAAKRGQKVAA